MYVADSYPSNRISVFSSSGTFLRDLTGTPARDFGNQLAVSVDPTTGDLYVAESNNRSAVSQFSATGSFKGEFQVPAGAAAADPADVAIDAATGDLYVSDEGNGGALVGQLVDRWSDRDGRRRTTPRAEPRFVRVAVIGRRSAASLRRTQPTGSCVSQAGDSDARASGSVAFDASVRA